MAPRPFKKGAAVEPAARLAYELRQEVAERMIAADVIRETKTSPDELGAVDVATAHRLASFFGALGDPTRVRIIATLAEDEHCVGDVAEALGMSQSAISHQLRLLRELRLVRARRDGRQIYYSLDDDHIERVYRQGLDHVRHG